MPALDVSTVACGSVAAEHRPAGSSSGRVSQTPIAVQSMGFSGYTFRNFSNTPEKNDNTDMERRVTNLENDMRDVRERLVRVETKLDTAQQKLDGLPNKDFVTAAVSSGVNKTILWVIGVVGGSQLIPHIALPVLKHFGIGQ